jgi:hypothetical protein
MSRAVWTRCCIEAWLSGNPPGREFVVNNSNDAWRDTGWRTVESRIATGLTATPRRRWTLLQRLWFSRHPQAIGAARVWQSR